MNHALITNPRSRQNRADPTLAATLARILDVEPHTPTTLADLAASVPALASADRLLVHGGDGTLHQLLTAFGAAGVAPPPLGLLRGGTMNIVADSIGQRRGAVAAAEGFAAGSATRSELRCPLVVDIGGQTVRGFLAGGGIISRFLELYYALPDPSPAAAGWLLARGAVSAVVGGSLAARLLRPYAGAMEVDGARWAGDAWTAVAIGSVEQLGLGFTPFPRVSEVDGRMHVIGVGSGLAALATELPRVYFGRGLARRNNREGHASVVRLVSDEPIPFMVDGDFYRGDGVVRVSVADPVRFEVV